jgi:hypothetical protein
MIQTDAEYIADSEWEALEGCYRACVEVVHCVIESADSYSSDPTLLRMLCETQSAIRAAMEHSGAHPKWSDQDQEFLFRWCADEVKSRSIFVDHLSLDSLADPSLHAGRLARAKKLRADLSESRNQARMRNRGLNTIQYHVKQLSEDPERTAHHWKRIGDGIADCIRGGMAPSSPELVNELIPVCDDVPDDVFEMREVRLVMRYVDERIASQQESEVPAAIPARMSSAEVRRVREALRGSTMVIIGGDVRPHSRRAIESEFELAELKWLASKEHSSLEAFRAAVEHPETKVVAIMIRWASHSYEDIQEIAESASKIFVRLPRGYNPATIAHEICEQASDRLGMN